MIRVACRLAPRISGFMLCALVESAPVLAAEFSIGGLQARLGNQLTLGAQVRMQERAAALTGLSNLPGQEALCYEGPYTTDPDDNPDTLPFDCQTAAGGLRLSELPGNTANAFDNGNLNYDRHELTAAVVKLTQTWDFSFDRGSFPLSGRLRYLSFHDAVNAGFREHHQNTTYQPRRTRRAGAVEQRIGTGIELLDGWVATEIPLGGGEPLVLRLGKQVVNWGESTLIVPYSLNASNPINVNRVNTPGFDPSEIFIPNTSLFAGYNLTAHLGVEAYYQFEFQPVVTSPQGAFLSTADVAGDGGEYLMLGVYIEDPLGLRRPGGPPGTVANLEGMISQSTRRAQRIRSDEVHRLSGHRSGPDGAEFGTSGGWGVKLRWFAEEWNNTEFGLYWLRQRSLLPILSLVAAESTCLDDPGTTSVTIPGLGTLTDVPPCAALAATGEDYNGRPANLQTLPQDTLKYFIEYPDGISILGLSFNTTIGDLAFQGEYAHRIDAPLQVHPVDLVYAGLNPAFPEDGYTFGGQRLIAPRRQAAPDLIEYRYRGNTDLAPREYVRGYARLDVGQFNFQVTRLASDNPFDAGNWITLLELGATYVYDMPSHADGFYLAAPGSGNHPSPGRADLCRRNADGSISCDPAASGLINVRRADDSRFPTAFSWGYRLLNVLQYPQAFGGINLNVVNLFFHDVHGIAPGPAENFVRRRKQIATLLNFDLNQFRWGVGYTVYTGASSQNLLGDRDYFSAFIGYDF